MYVTNMTQGKCNIILSGAGEDKVAQFCDRLKKNVKDYFNQYRVTDVFIAIGMMSYSSQTIDERNKDWPSNVKIKEIYIGSEMRRFKRVDYNTEMRIHLPKGTQQSVQTLDLSEKGVCFVSSKMLRTDTKIKVSFQLLKRKKKVETETLVRWIKEIERGPDQPRKEYKIGIEFVLLRPADQKLLKEEISLLS
jgi:hypothetical protein